MFRVVRPRFRRSGAGRPRWSPALLHFLGCGVVTPTAPSPVAAQASDCDRREDRALSRLAGLKGLHAAVRAGEGRRDDEAKGVSSQAAEKLIRRAQPSGAPGDGARGADRATISLRPAVAMERNVQRMGFQVGYAKAILVRAGEGLATVVG